MIRITSTSLIIEIPTKNQNPLSFLSDLTNGMLDLIAVAETNNTSAPEEELRNGLRYATTLVKSLTPSIDQFSVLAEALSEKQKQEFNNWGTCH